MLCDLGLGVIGSPAGPAQWGAQRPAEPRGRESPSPQSCGRVCPLAAGSGGLPAPPARQALRKRLFCDGQQQDAAHFTRGSRHGTGRWAAASSPGVGRHCSVCPHLWTPARIGLHHPPGVPRRCPATLTSPHGSQDLRVMGARNQQRVSVGLPRGPSHTGDHPDNKQLSFKST